MWSRGTRRPPRPPHKSRRSKGSPAANQRQITRESSGAAAVQHAPSSTWRRLRHRLRVLWRWVVVRNLRHMAMHLAGRPDLEDYGPNPSMGDVRQFPNGR